MAYVDGFVIPVPKNKLEAYLDMSRQCATIWRELGATEFRECVADDVKPGKLTSFPQSVNLREDQVVPRVSPSQRRTFSWLCACLKS